MEFYYSPFQQVGKLRQGEVINLPEVKELLSNRVRN